MHTRDWYRLSVVTLRTWVLKRIGCLPYQRLGQGGAISVRAMIRSVYCSALLITAALVLVAAGCDQGATPRDDRAPIAALPSWNAGAAKAAIVEFVSQVTHTDGPEFVAAADRIAVFDNDGTLWSEQPAYFQFFFALDRLKTLAPQHPEWKQEQPFKAAIEGDMATLAAGGTKALLEIVMATHAGMTTEEFERIVVDWISTARHPQRGRPFTELTFRPMIELLDYLRANGFKTYIVSGGGVEFMRPWAPSVYGVPPEQIIGSSIKTRFDMQDGKPVLLRLPEVDFIDDGPGKPVGINKFIGRRPIVAFGNSDGDLQMLEWTAAGPGARLVGLVHHTDSEREWAYDRQSHVGRLDKALDEARQRGWTIVDMETDWNTIHAAGPDRIGSR
jgi:haloacid dehalogenase-like hydrolase